MGHRKTRKTSPKDDKYAVFGLIDPRTEEMFWVGAGSAQAWRYRATRSYSDGKARRISEIEAAGFHAEPELIALCWTRKEAMRIKIDFCRRIGQAFRGGKVRRKDRNVYLAKHAGTGPLASPAAA